MYVFPIKNRRGAAQRSDKVGGSLSATNHGGQHISDSDISELDLDDNLSSVTGKFINGNSSMKRTVLCHLVFHVVKLPI